MMTLLGNQTLVLMNNDKKFFFKDKIELKEQLMKKKKDNTVVSNHFHSVKYFYFHLTCQTT
jgi:hypothetical protein